MLPQPASCHHLLSDNKPLGASPLTSVNEWLLNSSIQAASGILEFWNSTCGKRKSSFNFNLDFPQMVSPAPLTSLKPACQRFELQRCDEAGSPWLGRGEHGPQGPREEPGTPVAWKGAYQRSWHHSGPSAEQRDGTELHTAGLSLWNLM